MNELTFVIHILLVVFLSFGALRVGKEALVVMAALMAVLANFFVLKEVLLFGWNVTCSDVFAVGITLNLNLLQEYFGKESARQTIRLCFFSMLFFGLMSQVHLMYTPSLQDTSHLNYLSLLTPAPRLLIASLVSFFLVQQVDIKFFALLKTIFPRWSWNKRNLIALFNAQLLDTLLFSALGLYGIVSSILDIIIFSFVIKMIIILSMTFFAQFSKRFIRHEV
ncbi:MAG: queuosine precursor transporter [Rhabdochlamydiaceae bacterium]